MATKALTQEDLEKGLRALEAAARPPQSARASELFTKAQTGSITPEEREELVKSLGGDNALAARSTTGLQGETIQKSLDVSDYLRDQHKGLVAGLETLAEHIEKSEAHDQEFRVALATTLVNVGDLIKSQASRIESNEAVLKAIGDRLGVIAAQPARPPKSQPAAQPLAKGFVGAGNGDQLSKAQIEDAFSDMIEKGMDSVAGEDLLMAATKYESLRTITPALLAAVTAHSINLRKSSKAA